MAGTGDHYSIDDLEWLLITTAIALVERYTGSPDAAQEFLLIELSAKHIRYRYHAKLEFDGSAFPEPYFWWRNNKFVRHEITASAAVIRTGAALVPAMRSPQSVPPGWRVVYMPSDKDGDECYVLDVQQSVTVRMPLVQLHRDDIVHRLRERRFMSASDSTSAQQELPLSAPSPPPPSPPSSEQAKHHKEMKTDFGDELPCDPGSLSTPRPGSADAWIEELFSSDWRLLKPKAMHGRIATEVETRNKDPKRDKNAPQLQAPSLSAIRAALKNRRQKASAPKTQKT
jgi:hypothetical protein